MKHKTDSHKTEEAAEQPQVEEVAAPAVSQDAEKAREYLDQLIRLKADFENYRKRVEKEKPELIAFGKHQMLLSLLPLYETLLKAKTQLEKASCGGADSELCKGLDMIFKEFDKVFASEKIEVMDTAGKPYDPMCHEVLAVFDCPAEKDGLVIEEAQKGFRCGGKVLRPAKVCIGKMKEERPEPATDAAAGGEVSENKEGNK
jgi:molecular chaperone GrpE